MGVVDQSVENKMGPRGHMCAHVSAEARIQIKKTTGDQRGGQGEKLILNSDQVTTSLCHRIRTTRIRSSWKRRRRNFPRSNLHNEVHSRGLRLNLESGKGEVSSDPSKLLENRLFCILVWQSWGK